MLLILPNVFEICQTLQQRLSKETCNTWNANIFNNLLCRDKNKEFLSQWANIFASKAIT